MDKDGFVLPDMNVAPNERTATIQADSMTLHISPPEFIDVPWPAPRLGTSFDPSVVTIIVRIYSGLMQTAI